MNRKTISYSAGWVLLAAIASHPDGAWAQTAPQPQAAPAHQDSPDTAASVDDVVVTGSRLVTNGYQAPTPVTVVTAEALRDTAPSITEALRQLPQLTASSSPATATFSPQGGPSTTDSPNLRNLGPQRTLVLLDGRRPPVTGVTGTVDTSLFPQQLIKRVDIVTGGASAAYGSDALSGVVNYILDTKFDGLMVETRAGVSSRNDAETYSFELSGGRSFLDDRAHLIFNVGARGQEGLGGDERPWSTEYWATLANPNASQPGQPALLLRQNVNLSAATFGGIIITPGVLRDIQFDAAGNPAPYRHGTLNSGTLEVGGEGAHYAAQLLAQTRNENAFVHGTFDVSDRVSVFGELSYGVSKATYPNLMPFNLGGGAYQIRVDNAYLPTSVRNTMIANGLSTIAVAKMDLNYGRSVVENLSQTVNFATGLKADLGHSWSLDAYYTHSEALLKYGAANNRIQARSRLATDAVFNTATNSIVCRSTLTDPTNGCVPLSPFGTQALTDAQRAYVTGRSSARSLTTQDVVTATFSGDLFSTWAGPISAAIGGEYRRVEGRITTDAISQGLGFTLSNILPSGGEFDVKEGFAEVLVPLAKDLFLARNLDLNAAVRRTEYSTSGGVTTWKVGLTDKVYDDLTLRGTISRDIRAPNIGELFGSSSRTLSTIRDPQNGNTVVNNIFTYLGSNASLVPEEADTVTAGAVYRPGWLQGFGVSVDYYKLEIAGAIATLSSQTIVDQCFVGNASLCALLTRDGSGQLTQINATAQNVQTAKISGLDFEASYDLSILGGDLSLRGLATYLDTYQFISPGAPVIEQAGTGQRPKWRGNLNATFSRGPWAISVQERVIGESHRVIPPTTVDNNTVPLTFYTNLTVRYDLGDQFWGDSQLFATVNNLFDQKPRVGETNSCNIAVCAAYEGGLYDTVGTFMTVGLRARF